jgi:hypothetical protein
MHYNWPQDAEGIVSYVKQMAGPPSQLLSSLDQTEMIIKENPLTAVCLNENPPLNIWFH